MTNINQADGIRRLNGGLELLEGTRRRAIAVTGGKGGVGKSTIALNLSLAYARRGASVLVVDGDMGMADLNLLCGVAPEKNLLDVVRGEPMEAALVAVHGLHLLPALNGSHRLANLDARARERILDGVERLRQRFDTVIFDTPAGIGETAMGLAGAAADVIVVATPEPLSLADAYACLKVLASRHGVRRAFVLPNNVRSTTEADEICSRLAALVERFLGVELALLPPVPYDPAVGAAAAAGTPLVAHAPDSPAARAIRQAARRIDALARPPARDERLRGFLLTAEGGQ
jgi:flagellar biosynthesis protein FlhG